MNSFKWTPVTTPPSKTGLYLVGHRGFYKILHYLDPNRKTENGQVSWGRSNVLGWQEDIREFGATHWCNFEKISDEEDKEAEQILNQLKAPWYDRLLNKVTTDTYHWDPAPADVRSQIYPGDSRHPHTDKG